jgi:[ribosomal protein S5]-alanine N-acetyltransferase
MRVVPVSFRRDDAWVPSLMPPAMVAGSLSRSAHPSIPVDGVAALRPWLLADAQAVADAFRDPDIQRWHVRRADSVDEARQWISSWQAGWAEESQLNWALVDHATDVLLGRLSLKAVDLHDGSAGLAYWMVPASRGRGLCSQAVIALCQWAFNKAGFHRIEVEHSVANLASCRVAAKAGFREEGIRRDAMHADGWHDMHVHACWPPMMRVQASVGGGVDEFGLRHRRHHRRVEPPNQRARDQPRGAF